MNVLDLFSGIGGFSLGLERAGMRTVAFCEIEPFCRRVLEKHWPHVPCYDDVRALTADRIRADGIAVDVICGGFPCQDISSAGYKIGIDGKLSGLWTEYRRLIGELRPRYAVVENVADLLARGLGRVLGDLAEIGYDAEWHCISAASLGAPHGRDRIWIIAYPNGNGEPAHAIHDEASGMPAPGACSYADCKSSLGAAIARQKLHPWPPEPGMARVADGIPHRMDRVSSLGNSVLPQIPEIIGRAILAHEAQSIS